MDNSSNRIVSINKAKRILFNKYSLAALIVISVEYYISNLKHFHLEFGNLIFFGILYFISLVIVSLIKDAIATNELLRDDEIKSAISSLIFDAEEYIFIVTPFFSPGETLLRNIIQVAESNVRVIIIHNTKELENPQFLKIIKRLDGICKVYNHPNLHSKLYFNEKEFIITSLNLIQSSMMNSFEIGWISDIDDEFEAVKEYVKKEIINDNLTSVTEISKVEEKLGYCIRTNQRILFNKDHPIERTEYYKSKRASDGSFCHKCGEPSDTSIDNPFCEKHQSLLQE